MKIEILCTGDEILTGKTINTNYSYIAQRLTEAGLQAYWGTTVGDDRSALTAAFHQASQRADAVIVNGGLGPTVDDLSQEVAAEAAGVPLELHEHWLHKLETYYRSRGRVMPTNNRKQAMLPAGCEFIDNPVGTACGFAVSINKAIFYFTPGVPREMKVMIDQQIMPRLITQSGLKVVTKLKRFHTFGIGESRADQMLADIEAMAPDASIKLGFQSHYPQLETKLAAQAENEEKLQQVLSPIESQVRQRLGNFIVCEDNETLGGVIIDWLAAHNATLSSMEMTTGGTISQRLTTADRNNSVVRRCLVSNQLVQLCTAMDLSSDLPYSSETAETLAAALQKSTGASHTLVTLVNPADDAQANTEGRTTEGTDIHIALADNNGTTSRTASLIGAENWIALGAMEMALDTLRRWLTGLPIDEKIDFELHR